MGTRERVRIGLDAWLGSGNVHILPPDLKKFLEEASYYTLNQIDDAKNTTLFGQKWKFSRDLQTQKQGLQDSIIFTNSLLEAHVRIHDGEDELIWTLASHGRYTPKDGYSFIFA